MPATMRNTTSGDYISTGHLPSARPAQAAVDEAYRRYRSETSGVTSRVYPALARVSLFASKARSSSRRAIGTPGR